MDTWLREHTDNTETHPQLYPLLQQLHTIANTCNIVCATHPHAIKAVDIPRAQLGVVLQGCKQVSSGNTHLDINVGELLLTTRACSVNVVNLTDDHEQLYATVCIPIAEEVLQAAKLLYGNEIIEPLTASPANIASLDIAPISPLLLQWAQAVLQQDMLAARVALTAVVLQLVHLGYPQLLLPPSKDLKTHIYELVQSQPAHTWQSAEIEQRLNMSGATLRRRLAAEGISLKQVIVNARLNCALDMLYTTPWPMKTIAAKIGYQSVPAFNQRFQERYGLLPQQIRQV